MVLLKVLMTLSILRTDEKDQLLRIQDGLRYDNAKCAIAIDNGLITKDATKPFERVIEYFKSYII